MPGAHYGLSFREGYRERHRESRKGLRYEGDRGHLPPAENHRKR